MSVPKIAIYLIFVITGQSLCFANDEQKDISIGKKITIESQILNEEREIWIHTPKNYDANEKYHVLYLLDGDSYFHMTTGIVNFLTSNSFMSETIVVGVLSTSRVKDYMPPIKDVPKSDRQKFIRQEFPESGKANKFLSYLEKEIVPYIDKNYSTQPHRTLVGHSNAGVFALYALVSNPNLFINYLVISPAGWWSEQEIDFNIQQLFKNNKDVKGNLYMTIADEGGQMSSSALRVAANLEQHAPVSFTWTFVQMDKESHMSTLHPSIYDGLKNVYEEIKIKNIEDIARFSDVASVREFYQALSKKYNYPVVIPSSLLTEFAFLQLKYGKSKEAITTFKLNLQQNPDWEFAHKNLGDGFMANHQYSLAKSSYKKAVELGEKHNNKHIKFLKDKLKEAEGKVE